MRTRNLVAAEIHVRQKEARTMEGTRNLSSLVRAYFALGGLHLQVNVIDRETLLDVQQNPGEYPRLMASVAGYSAYLADLSKEAQDEAISRIEHGLL